MNFSTDATLTDVAETIFCFAGTQGTDLYIYILYHPVRSGTIGYNLEAQSGNYNAPLPPHKLLSSGYCTHSDVLVNKQLCTRG